MKNKSLAIFLSCWAVFVVALLATILCTDQAELHQTLTLGYIGLFDHTGITAQDLFFRYATELGATVPFVVGGLLLFYKVGDGLLILVSQGITAAIVYPIKKIAAAPRPSLFFAENFPDVALHQVDGVRLHQMYSFPSGHTAAVFSLMLCTLASMRFSRPIRASFSIPASGKKRKTRAEESLFSFTKSLQEFVSKTIDKNPGQWYIMFKR